VTHRRGRGEEERVHLEMKSIKEKRPFEELNKNLEKKGNISETREVTETRIKNTVNSVLWRIFFFFYLTVLPPDITGGQGP
jgi:hypothetical protein